MDSWKLRMMFHKAYFEKGYGLTAYTKWIIAFYGLAANDLGFTLILALFYIPFCYIVGRIWYKKGFITAEIEVGNRMNLFVKEMRKKFK